MSAPAAAPRTDVATRFQLTQRDFEEIAALLHALAGIRLVEGKQNLVQSRLSRRLRARGLTSFSEYVALLEDPAETREIDTFVNALTTNVTSFFRERHHFEDLETFLEARLAAGVRRIRIWCAACSIGAEPYSAAIVAHRMLRNVRGVDLKILATDIDSEALERARVGTYASEIETDLKPDERAFFKRDGDGWRIVDPVRALVHFRQLNLIGAWPMRSSYDVVFCRNVIIYFDADTKQRLIGRVAELLAPVSRLYLGHSETADAGATGLNPIGRTAYAKGSA